VSIKNEIGFVLKLSAQKFTAGASAATSSLQQLDNAAKNIGKSLDKHTGRALKRTTQAFTGLMAASAVVGARFDREMTFMGAITQATSQEMEGMTEKARELGRSTMFSATQAAQAMQNLARAGMTTNEIMEASGPALMLAGAAGTDMTTATNLLAATLAQFNLDATESSRVTDVFATAITSSLFDVNSLKEAMKYAGTVGQAFGMSIEESTAAVAQFRNIGLEGSLAGTNFRMAMQSAAVETEKKRRTLQKLGLTMADINPQYHTFGDILETLGNTSADVGDSLEIFGRRAGANMAGLIDNARQGNDEYGELLSTLESSVGQTDRLYQQATDNILDQAIIVKSAFQDILLSIFGTYQEPMSNMLTTIASSLNKTSESIQADADKTENAWTRMMERIEVYFILNAGNWGEIITNLMVKVANVAVTFIRWLPILADIATVMATIWAVNKVRAFSTVITGTVIPAMRSLAVAATQAGTAQRGFGGAGAMFSKAGLATLGKGLAKGAMRLTGYGVAIWGATKLVGPLTSGLRKLFGMTNNVGDAQERAAQAMRRYREQLDEVKKATDRFYSVASSQTNRWALQQLEAARSGDELSNSQRHELETLAELEAGQVRAAIAAGQMLIVKRELNGAMVDQIATQRQLADAMVAGEQAGATDEELEAAAQANVDRITYRQTLEDDYYNGTAKQARELRQLLEDLNQPTHTQRRYREQILLSQADSLGLEYESVDAARVLLELLNRRAAEERAILDNNKRLADLELERARARTQAVEDAAAAEQAREDEAAAKKWRSAWEAALKAVEKAHRKIREDWRDSRATDNELIGIEFERRVRDLRETYQTAIDLVGQASRRGTALLEQFYRDVRRMQLTLANEYVKAVAESNREAHQELMLSELVHSQDVAKERLRIALRNEGDIARNSYAAVEGNAVAQRRIWEAWLERKAILEEETDAEIANINYEHALEASEAYLDLSQEGETERFQIVAKWSRKVANLHESEIERRNTYERTMALELARYDRELRKETYEYVGREAEATLMELYDKLRTAADIQNDILRGQFEAVVLGQIDEQKKRLWLEQNFGFVLNELGELGQEIAYKFAGVFRGIANATVGVWSAITPAIGKTVGGLFSLMGTGAETLGFQIRFALGTAIESAWDTVKGPLATGFTVVAKSVKGVGFALKAVKATLGAMVSIVGAVGGAWTKVTDIVARFTGLSIDVLGTLSEARDLMKERADLQEEINSGQLTGDDLTDAQARLAEMPASAGAAAAQMIADQFTEATSFFKNLTNSLPAIFTEIMAQVPVFVAAIGETIPSLMGVVANNIGPLVNALLDGVLSLVDAVIDSLPNVIIAITDMIPGFIGKLMDAAPRILEFVFEAIAYIIGEIPKFVDVIVAKLPSLITALMDGLVDVVVALMQAAPKILKSLADALPSLIGPLMEGVVAIIIGISENLGPIIMAVVNAIPDIAAAIVNALPQIVLALGELMFTLIRDLIKLTLTVVPALIIMIPRFFAEVANNFWALLDSAFGKIKDWWNNFDFSQFMDGLGDAIWNGLKQMVGFFRDLIKEIVTLGYAETQSFGDTPEVMTAGSGGALTRFAPGDLFLAAKTPAGLLKQLAGSLGSMGLSSPSAPEMDLSAIPSMVSALGNAVLTTGSSGGGDLRVTVVAEGKTLDDVLYTAGKRGHTPSLKQDLRRASGATVGLDRGRFSSQS
jgi:TP901 family phage tail tape measure protein